MAVSTKKDPQAGWLQKLKKYKSLKSWHGLVPLAVFLILIVPAGLYLVFSVPSMWAPDGGAHVARVFQIAEGGMRPVFINHNHGVGYGGAIPTNVNDLKNYELDIVSSSGIPGTERTTKLLTPAQKAAINQISSHKIAKQRILISFINTAAYSPVAYLPSVIGVKLGILLNLNLGHTLRLAGLLGFLTYLICAGYSLLTLRASQLKWIVMTASLLPLAVFQTTVVTADSFLMSVSILFSALLLKGLTGNKLNNIDKTLLFLSVLALPLLKSVYFLLVFLVLLIPRNQWAKQSTYRLWMASSLILSLAGFAIWSGPTVDVAASNGLVRGDLQWTYGTAKLQRSFILHHPLGYLHALTDSFIYQSKFYIDTYFGWLGFTYLPIPGLAQTAGFYSLGLSVLLAGKTAARKYLPTIMLGALALTGLVIFTTLYITFTLYKNPVIEGVQGRYFLPLTTLALAVVALALPKLRISSNGLQTAKILLVCLVTFTLWFSVLRYGLAIN